MIHSNPSTEMMDFITVGPDSTKENLPYRVEWTLLSLQAICNCQSKPDFVHIKTWNMIVTV